MEEKNQKNISRRGFLGLAWAGGLVVMGGQWLAGVLKYLKPVSGGGFGGLVYAGRVDEFEIGSINRILAGRFYVVRSEQGVMAIWQRCTHLGCAVPYDEAAGQFHCPCHGSLFNDVGEVLGGPAPRPLDTFPVTIKDGEIWVDTSKPVERSSFDPSQFTPV